MIQPKNFFNRAVSSLLNVKMWCIFTILFSASCGNIKILSSDIEKISSCQQTINGMLLLTNHDILPQKGFYTGKEAKADVNRYFKVLEHLSMESGYAIDYVQFLDSWGAKPLIYARQSNKPSYKSYSDYTESVNNVGNEEYSWQELANTYDYLEHVRIDGTADGFFQFVVLRIMGNQFYLDWHALYNDTIIICNSDTVSALEQRLHLPAQIVQSAKTLNFTPAVELKRNEAIIKVVLFTKWGGFKEVVYVISRDFPHKLLNTKVLRQIKYDFGVRF